MKKFEFYHMMTRSSGQHMAIHLLFFFSSPSNGPIRAKQITHCCPVIGQYDKVSRGLIRELQIRPYLRHVHWTCVHRVYSWILGWERSIRWGSSLTIKSWPLRITEHRGGNLICTTPLNMNWFIPWKSVKPDTSKNRFLVMLLVLFKYSPIVSYRVTLW